MKIEIDWLLTNNFEDVGLGNEITFKRTIGDLSILVFKNRFSGTWEVDLWLETTGEDFPLLTLPPNPDFNELLPFLNLLIKYSK